MIGKTLIITSEETKDFLRWVFKRAMIEKGSNIQPFYSGIASTSLIEKSEGVKVDTTFPSTNYALENEEVQNQVVASLNSKLQSILNNVNPI